MKGERATRDGSGSVPGGGGGEGEERVRRGRRWVPS